MNIKYPESFFNYPTFNKSKINYSRLRRLFVLVIVALQMSALVHADELCQIKPTPPSNYLKIQSEIDHKIQDFSNLPAFAKKADALLSKLITAKSPVIITWMNKRNLQTKTEEEVLQEWRKYFALNFIISKYPYNEIEMDLPVEFLFTSINRLFAKKHFIEKMESLFKKAQTNAVATILKYKLNKAIETQITSRILSNKLYWAPNLKESKFRNQVLEFLDWGIAYDPITNEINMGIQALAYPNDETYLALFSHEIAHAFDSCRWGAFFSEKWPFEKLGICLRSSGSAGAKTRDDSQLEVLIKAGKITTELALSMKLNPTCNKTNYPPAGFQADQLPETFADWFSAEAMAQLELPKTTNLRADLCLTKTLNPGSSYLSNKERLEKIYFANLKLKNASSVKGTKSTTKYCAFQ